MTIFLGGVHAAGKTTLLKKLSTDINLKWASASQLIKEEIGIENWTETRIIRTVSDNQEALINAVKKKNFLDKNFIVDGHFVLRTSPMKHEEISSQVFKEISTKGVILIEAQLDVIRSRLHLRGDFSWSDEEILDFSSHEKLHAVSICQELSVPLIKLENPSINNLRDSIYSIINSSN